MSKVIIPENYHSCLSSYETQEAIGVIKHLMEKKLCMALKLKRVTAPLFVDPASGLNDDLNGVERPVTFDIPDAGTNAQVVHSLAKWKRMALYRYDFHVGKGLLTDMNAIRSDEELGNLHSLYVDQWDWERVMGPEERNIAFLKEIVCRIYAAMVRTEYMVYEMFPERINIVSPYLQVMLQSTDLLERDMVMVRRCVEEGVIKPENAGKMNHMVCFLYKGYLKDILDYGIKKEEIEPRVRQFGEEIREIAMVLATDRGRELLRQKLEA